MNKTSINHFVCSQFINTAWLNIVGLEPLINYKRFKEVNKKPLIENGKYKFEELSNQKSSLVLASSDMGKTSFVNCQLDKFDEFVFSNTKMLEVFVAGTTLPNAITLPTIPDGVQKTEQERLAFSQFKKISDNRGDNVQATEFLALEMQAYRSQLRNKIKEKKVFTTEWWNILGEQANLWLNRVSSYYGNNWVSGVFVTFGVNSLCFWLYCVSLGYCLGNDWKMFMQSRFSERFFL